MCGHAMDARHSISNSIIMGGGGGVGGGEGVAGGARGKRPKGRTGWPQHVWAQELKPDTTEVSRPTS